MLVAFIGIAATVIDLSDKKSRTGNNDKRVATCEGSKVVPNNSESNRTVVPNKLVQGRIYFCKEGMNEMIPFQLNP